LFVNTLKEMTKNLARAKMILELNLLMESRIYSMKITMTQLILHTIRSTMTERSDS